VVATDARFSHAGSRLRVQLSNPAGLRDVAFALPRGGYVASDAAGLRCEPDGDDDVWIVTDDATDCDIELERR
jgi:hypothetical protein